MEFAGGRVHEVPQQRHCCCNALSICEDVLGELVGKVSQNIGSHRLFKGLKASKPRGNALENDLPITRHGFAVVDVVGAAAPRKSTLDIKVTKLDLQFLKRPVVTTNSRNTQIVALLVEYHRGTKG